jgi:hypothetical protein
MQHVMEGFKKMLGLPCIQGAIDVVQIHIRKPKFQAYATNYYYFKSKSYSLQLQVIVDHRICFLDVGDARVFE